MRHDGRAARRLRTLGVAEDVGHFVVGQARGRVDHGRIELVSLDLALGGDDGVAHQRQTVDGRVQRAQAVRQFFRQHRNHAAREVDGSAAFQRVDVERVVRLDVMADVGDRDDQAEGVGAADLDRLAIHGIVEVARVLAVDGDHRHVAQVDAVGQVGVAHHAGQLFSLLERGGGEDMRHAELAHGDFDFHAGIVERAQHFDDLADRLLEAHRLFRQFDADDLARLGLADGTGNDDVLADALVFRRDDPAAVFIQQAADDVGVGAGDHLDDGALRAAAAVGAGDLGHDAVAVQHFLHLFFGQEQVVARLVRDDEAEAVALHGPESARQHGLCVFGDFEGLGQGAQVKRRLGAAEDAENFLPAGDGVGRLVQKYFYSYETVIAGAPA